MNSASITTGLKYIVGCGAILFFAVILTLVFSFLGTLVCAALSGIMMGATKASKKLSIPFSAFFPCVLVAVLRVQKSEIAGTQLISLAILCLAVFWTVYLAGAVLMACEKKDGGDLAFQAASGLTLQGKRSKDAAAAGASVPGPPELRLEELDGHWSCESCGRDGITLRKLLEIKDGSLALSTLDCEGHVFSCVRGCVALVALSGNSTLLVSTGTDAVPSPSI